jgi:hypothetical protein
VVRPRFFAGQLLTEAELIALEQYVMTKHQLHNRYLHGWGVVCGLEVMCGDCGDDLVVHSGYAIDPCGRDVIVPETTRFDILKAIRQCVEAERAKPNCDPPTPGPPPGCDDEEHWCVTVRYKEWDTRVVTPLGPSAKPSCNCGGSTCGCGGSQKNGTAKPGWSCTCGSGGSRSTGACGCMSPSPPLDRPAGCEPSRTIECFELGACRSQGTCRDLEAALAGSFPVRLIECLKVLRDFFEGRLSRGEQKAAALLVLGDKAAAGQDNTRGALCKLYDAILELYERDPLRTHCVMPEELQSVDCSEQRTDEASDDYRARMATAAQLLLFLVLAYVRDCICHALLPPCPEDVCDDRQIIACVTIKGGKVTDICNFECRRFAGSFVARNYWLPIGPVASWALAFACCFPLLGRRFQATRTLLDRVDPISAMRMAVMRDDFAVMRDWRVRAARFVKKLRPDAFARSAPPPSEATKTVNLAALSDEKSSVARDHLASSGIDVAVVKVDDPDLVPVASVGLFPFARAGEKLVQYVHGDRVVGYRRGEPAPSVAPTGRATAAAKAGKVVKKAPPQGGNR